MVLGGPQVLDCVGPPRLPPPAVGDEGSWGGGQAEHGGALHHAHVRSRESVGVPERTHGDHLGRPWPDATEPGQLLPGALPVGTDADFGFEVAFQLAGAVAEAGCQTTDTLPVDGAICDEPHRPGNHILAHVPLRRAGQGIGAAALTCPEPGMLGRRGSRVERDIAGQRRAGRATGPAVDPGG